MQTGGGPREPVHAFAVRLVAIAAVFALAVLIQLRGVGLYSERQLAALYALVLAGFLLALAYGALAAYGRTRRRVPAVELGGDGALIAGLVYCSGGSASPFAFLYTIWIAYATVRAGSRGAAWACGGAIASFGAIAFGEATGWLPPLEAAPRLTPDGAATVFGMHTAAFLAVALLARRLDREVTRGRAELWELGEIHRRIVDNVTSGLMTVDGGGRVTSFNREAERISGYRASSVVGKLAGEVFPTLEGVESGALARAELEFRNRDGRTLTLGFSQSPLRDAAGAPEGGILIFQDLTRVRDMEEQLRRSERLSAAGQLATGLAHEIRNPLASLSGAIELLADDLPGSDASSRRLLRIVHRETARLNRLVGDFLAYAGVRAPRREVVPLADALEEIRALLGAGGHPEVELIVEQESPLAVLGDPDQLRQVLWNLILNAAESEPADQRVRVNVRAGDRDPPRVEVEVCDRGAGIPPEVADRVFEPFYTTKPKGTGLGLATVHRVVEAHGGSLRVASEPGEGTRICVTLPAPPGRAGAA